MRIICLCILLSIVWPATAQKAVLSNEKMNVLYIAIMNPIQVAVEQHACRDIELSTTNGKLKKTGEPCSYEMYPEKVGLTAIYVRSKKLNRYIDTFYYRTKDLPQPVIRLAGQHCGVIRRKILAVQLGLVAMLEGFDFDARYVIKSFAMSVVRNGQIIFEGRNEGAAFTGAVTGFLDKILANDTVIFSDIIYLSPDGSSKKAEGLRLQVVEI